MCVPFRLAPPVLHQRSVTMVAPQPPAAAGASRNSVTKGVRESTERTISRCAPMPRPWMMRRAREPIRCASMRYSSTTARTSRGGMVCKSNTSVMGIRIGSSSSVCISPHVGRPFLAAAGFPAGAWTRWKARPQARLPAPHLFSRKPKNEKPGPTSGAGQEKLRNYRCCAHLTLSNLLRPGLAHDRFHLILQAEFQFLQPHFLQLLMVGQVGKRFQLVQLVGELRVLAGEATILLICIHQMRFQLFQFDPFHIGQFLPV